MKDLLDCLEETLHSIDTQVSDDTWPESGNPYAIVFPLIGFGAEIRASLDEDERARVDAAISELARKGASHDLYASGLTEYHMETLAPSPEWPEAHQALFWRVKGKAFGASFSDAGLNVTASALEQAVPWHLEYDPAVALDLIARRARAMSYASYASREVLPPLGEAFEAYDGVELCAEDELRFIVQVCEVLGWHAPLTLPQVPHAERRLALGLRALELCEELGDPAFAGWLHDSVADAVFRGPEGAWEAQRSRLEAMYQATGRFEIAKAAWRRAIETETGAFYGKQRPERRPKRIERYERLLGLVILRTDGAEAALDLLDRPQSAMYRTRQNANEVHEILRQFDASPAEQRSFLERAFRRDVLGASDETMSGYGAKTKAVEYAEFVFHHLWSLGAKRAEIDALVQELEDQPWHAEAAKELQESREAPLRESEQRLLDALLGSMRQSAQQTSKQAKKEPSPEQRLNHILYAVPGEVTKETQSDLLFYDVVDAKVDDSALRVRVKVNAPHHAFEQVLEDARVADALGALDSRLRRELREQRPDLDLDVEIEPLCRPLDSGVGEPELFAFALAHAGATELLGELGLAHLTGSYASGAQPSDEELEQHRSLQSARRKVIGYTYY